MSSTDIQQIVLKIIQFAQTTELTKFRFICNWTEYKYFKGKRKAYKVFVRALRKGATRLLNTYCAGVIDGSAKFTKLLAFQQMSQVINFYEQEIETFTNMIYEYEAYLLDGNFLDSFLGKPRAEEDLRDFRE